MKEQAMYTETATVRTLNETIAFGALSGDIAEIAIFQGLGAQTTLRLSADRIEEMIHALTDTWNAMERIRETEKALTD
jgi:hypothetical protein